MTDYCDVFLSYSRNDREAAAQLRAQLRQAGLSVFKDDDSIRGGDLWLNQLQAAIAACGSFVVLVGRDGVGRWIGAETQAALRKSQAWSTTVYPASSRTQAIHSAHARSTPE